MIAHRNSRASKVARKRRERLPCAAPGSREGPHRLGSGLLLAALTWCVAMLLIVAAPLASLHAEPASAASSPYGPAIDQPGLIIPVIRMRAEILP